MQESDKESRSDAIKKDETWFIRIQKNKTKRIKKKQNIKYACYTYLLFIIHLNTRGGSAASFDVRTMVCDATSLGKRLPTFRMNGSPSSSMSQRFMNNAENERYKSCKAYLRP
jgi:hypothetical protein